MSPGKIDFFRPLVLSGPSGVGKSTLLRRLFAESPDDFGFNTTRLPRPGEEEGKQYYFVTRERFEVLRRDGAFIENAEFSGNAYGTSFETVREIQGKGKRCILDIDAQGVHQIKSTTLNPVYLFISPPSMTALRDRLKQRGTEGKEAVKRRLAAAVEEIRYAKTPNVHDIVIINDDLDRAYELFKRAALGEKIAGDSLPLLDD